MVNENRETFSVDFTAGIWEEFHQLESPVMRDLPVGRDTCELTKAIILRYMGEENESR